MLIEGIVHEEEGAAGESPIFLTTPKPGEPRLEVLVIAQAATMLTLGSFCVQGPVEAR